MVFLLGATVKTRKRIREQKRNRIRVKKAAETLLDRQIEILSQESLYVTLELEIAKFLKDGLLMCLEKGTCTPRDALKAHKWLWVEFPDEFKLFMDNSEEWEKRSSMLAGLDTDSVQKEKSN